MEIYIVTGAKEIVMMFATAHVNIINHHALPASIYMIIQGTVMIVQYVINQLQINGRMHMSTNIIIFILGVAAGMIIELLLMAFINGIGGNN